MSHIRKSLLLTILIAITTASALYAFGSREVPQIQVKTPSPWYLSPSGASSSAVHRVSVAFTVTMAMKSKTGYVPEYSVSIENASTNVVKDIVKRQKPDLGFFSRLFSARKSFTLEKTISWNGTDSSDRVVPDGNYPAKLTVFAQDGTRRTVDLGTFVVDTQAPSVTVDAPDGLVFDPTGRRAKLQIDQTNGTVEQLWTGSFYNASDQVVRTYTWKNSAPQSFSWNGRDNNGRLLPDGHYTYRITSTDRAGNKSPSYQVGGIVINTQKTPVSLKLSNPYFSPNGDGVKDTTTIELASQSKVPVESWKVTISNPVGKVVRSFEGQGTFPSQEVFNGKDSSGNLLSDATYTVTFDAAFQNGNEGETTAPLVLDTSRPLLAVTYSNPVFSPNGDGSKDTTTASLSLKSSEPASSWQLEVTNGSGTVVRKTSGSGMPPTQVVFDGMNGSGQTLSDGTYEGIFQVTLADGMSNSATKSFIIDTKPPKVVLSISSKVFMPNGTGSNSTEVISYTTNKPVTWTGELVNNQNQVLLRTPGPMSIDKVVLDKSNPTVEKAPAGLYVLNLTFEDSAGNTYSPPPADISLFTHPINTSMRVAKAGFSPRAPSGSNTISADLSTDTPSGIDGYTVAVLNRGGAAVASFKVRGSLRKEFAWDGSTSPGASNAYPPDGVYRMRLTTHYMNGLESSADSNRFLLDVNPPQITAKAATSAHPFVVTANGKDIKGTISGSLAIADAGRQITSWTVNLFDPSGSRVKSGSGSGPLNTTLSVNGQFPLGGPAPTTTTTVGYRADITATDQYGNTASSSVALPLRTIGRVEHGRIRLLVPNLLFGPYKYALNSKSAEQGKANEQTLSLVSDILKSYPSYGLELDGYSMEIYSPGTARYDREEDIIVPLSKNRADIARTALEQLGISGSRIHARYWGGMDTLVDPHNVALRWKNRRVEFILLPEGTPPTTEPLALVKRLETARGASSGQ